LIFVVLEAGVGLARARARGLVFGAGYQTLVFEIIDFANQDEEFEV